MCDPYDYAQIYTQIHTYTYKCMVHKHICMYSDVHACLWIYMKCMYVCGFMYVFACVYGQLMDSLQNRLLFSFNEMQWFF